MIAPSLVAEDSANNFVPNSDETRLAASVIPTLAGAETKGQGRPDPSEVELQDRVKKQSDDLIFPVSQPFRVRLMKDMCLYHLL